LTASHASSPSVFNSCSNVLVFSAVMWMGTEIDDLLSDRKGNALICFISWCPSCFSLH
jgi:hypothetical protein